MHIIDTKDKNSITVAACIYDMPSAFARAVSHLNDYIQCEGFPFDNFEIVPAASWYDSRWKEYRYKFRFRWL